MDPSSLQNLHDIVVPDPVPWWPPAPGWYVLGAVILAALIWLLWRWIEHWKTTAYRRAALAELNQLSVRSLQANDRLNAVRDLNVLLKRTALAFWSRTEVAGLSGEQWLEFLDRTGGTNAFSQGPGRLLPNVSYAKPHAHNDFSENQVADLMETAKRWIKMHKIVER